MGKYAEIIERLREALGPDRRIDRDIAEHVVGTRYRVTKRGREWLEDSHGGVETWVRQPTPYTSSIDAAVALAERMLPGTELEMTNLYGVARVTLHDVECSFHGECHCNRLQTALLIALFRAMDARDAHR